MKYYVIQWKNLLHATKCGSLRHNVELRNTGTMLHFVLWSQHLKFEKRQSSSVVLGIKVTRYPVRMDGDQKRHSGTVHWIGQIRGGGRGHLKMHQVVHYVRTRKTCYARFFKVFLEMPPNTQATGFPWCPHSAREASMRRGRLPVSGERGCAGAESLGVWEPLLSRFFQASLPFFTSFGSFSVKIMCSILI